MTSQLLICTDLDRTLLPNGLQPESPGVRERFAVLAARPEVTLAYVSGRHRELVEHAIEKYALPLPNYVIADVGTTIYAVVQPDWRVWSDWEKEIAPDWAGMDNVALRSLFLDLQQLRLQEADKQNTFKLSYYASLDVNPEPLLKEMQNRLESHTIHASLIWSVDEPAEIGLLDVLPARATKLHAVEFLMRRRGFSPSETLFAGDSGNDLPVLSSGLPSVLVANAGPEICQQALQQAKNKGSQDMLYLAQGDFHGMNGNYAAGILEGLAHYHPHTKTWWDKA
jgi:HAD superfamily hydrolase (TIGR01484 family)